MLVLVSGLPGHGKTLYTLQLVESLRRESGRQVYYHGITDLALPWHQLDDPKKWHELPDGAIVVVDEAWQHFPKRSPGALVPPWVQQLATHRHRGFDVYLVTQHPANQLDHFVRGLVGRHHHVRRVFGSQRSRVYTWDELGNHADWHSMKKAVTAWFKFPAEVFTWYKSAEVHTVKRQVPWKPFAIIGGGSLAVLACGWLVWHQLVGSVDRVDHAADRADQALAPGAGVPLVKRGAGIQAEDFVATAPGIPFTAPFYRDALKVEDVPIVSGCGVLKVGHQVTCRCTDQQGQVIAMEHRQCLALFDHGMFQPGRAGRYPEIEPYVPPLAPPLGMDAAADQAQPGRAAAQGDSQS